MRVGRRLGAGSCVMDDPWDDHNRHDARRVSAADGASAPILLQSSSADHTHVIIPPARDRRV